MDSDVALLNEKIDRLTSLVQAQNERLAALEANGNGSLHAKLDTITSQFDAQMRKQDELDELKRDLIPIANHMIKLSIDELAEIGSDFQIEDLFFLLKRLLRDTQLLTGLLDRFEATVDLVDDMQTIGNQAFHEAIHTLDRLEREGYFDFARGGWRIVERVVAEFSQDDINALGDNVVTILRTVRNLTQPEIMTMTNRSLEAIREAPVDEKQTSMMGLLRELSDPQVRKGMARLLNMLRVLADQPQAPQQN